jgi:phosphate:Na+ symporter
LDGIWDTVVNSGIIANTNTIFNLAASILLFPVVGVFERTSIRLVPDDKEKPNKYQDKLDALNPMFFDTPALALRSCYDILLTLFHSSRDNIEKSFGLLEDYDEKIYEEIAEEEANIDLLADRVSRYIVEFLPHIHDAQNAAILDQYYKVVTDFERLGDHGLNIADNAGNMHRMQKKFTPTAISELHILEDLLREILDNVDLAFGKRDVDAAFRIEPLQQVATDMVSRLKRHHLDRMSKGECDIYTDANFENLMSDMQRIADVSTNIGEATLVRVNPELAENEHDYFAALRSGQNKEYNEEFNRAYEKYKDRFKKVAENG